VALDQGVLPYVFIIAAVLTYVVADLVYADLSRRFNADPAAGGRQKLTFLGNSTGDWKLNAHKAGQFYYNTASDKLVIDATGDGVADHYIGVKGITSMKADYFLL
jgi:hypothetical protein